MSRSRLKVIVLCLLLTLGASWSLSATPHKPAPARASAVDSPWNLFAHLWGSLTSLWGQAGASLDPDGQSATRPTTDEGCSADPDGRCTAGATTDAGASLDPNG